MNFYKNKLNDFLILLRDKELFVPLRSLNRNLEQTAVLYFAWIPFFLISLGGSEWISSSILFFQLCISGLHLFDFFDLKNRKNFIEYNIIKTLDNQESQKILCDALQNFIEEIKTIETKKKKTFRHIFFLDLGARLDKHFNVFMKSLFNKNMQEATHSLLKIFNIMNNKNFQEQFFNSNLYNVITDSFSKYSNNNNEEIINRLNGLANSNGDENILEKEKLAQVNNLERELEIGFMKEPLWKKRSIDEQIHINNHKTNTVIHKTIIPNNMYKQESNSTLEDARVKKLEEKL